MSAIRASCLYQRPSMLLAAVTAAAIVVTVPAHPCTDLHDLEPMYDRLDRGHAVDMRVEDGLIAW